MLDNTDNCALISFRLFFRPLPFRRRFLFSAVFLGLFSGFPGFFFHTAFEFLASVFNAEPERLEHSAINNEQTTKYPALQQLHIQPVLVQLHSTYDYQQTNLKL